MGIRIARDDPLSIGEQDHGSREDIMDLRSECRTDCRAMECWTAGHTPKRHFCQSKASQLQKGADEQPAPDTSAAGAEFALATRRLPLGNKQPSAHQCQK